MKKGIGFVCCFLFGLTLEAQLSREDYLLTGLRDVTDIANAGDNSNRLFFAERDGDIFVNQVGTSTLTLFHSVNPTHGGERGLLGLVFHPNFSSNGFFFVNYTVTVGGELTTRISRFQVSGSSAGSERILMDIAQPFDNHNGGDLEFDGQGHLFIALGDGGSGGDPDERAQDLKSALGKILRIIPSTASASNYNAHSIPSGNPFANTSVDTIKEIWHWGLRNPWRIHIDDSDNLWIGDVGQNAKEEINFVSNNQPLNFGWDCLEGTSSHESTSCDPNATYTPPVFEYTNPSVGRSITGGVVLPTSRYPVYGGRYIFGDYGSDVIWVLSNVSSNGRSMALETLDDPITRISTFGLDESGNAYGASLSGQIYRYVDAALPISLLSTEISRINEKVQIRWSTSSEINGSHFELERRIAGGEFQKIGEVPTKGNPSTESTTDYHYDDNLSRSGKYYYRLKTVDLDGSFTYSIVLHIEIDPSSSLMISPNPARDVFRIQLPGGEATGHLTIADMSGKILLERVVNSEELLEFSSAKYPSGVKLVTYRSKGTTISKKLFIRH